MNFTKILIANRAEIASRIIRTCKRMGIQTVAVYHKVDEGLPYVKEADTAVMLSGKPTEVYLDAEQIIGVAGEQEVDAIHPGYGFLSENADFASRCENAGIKFIGPSAEAIRSMGAKDEARKIAEAAKVPIVPGHNGEHQEVDEFVVAAGNLGYPVLLKAAAGGGGRGMRIVRSNEELTEQFDSAKREALAGFGNDHLILEKFFEHVRHIEIQVFGDEHGNVIHLFERECSLQRRHQKVIEEAPSGAISEALRTEICKAAVEIAASMKYSNAGTVEFILTPEEEFYLLEMNTRLQVEHPVTELITGIDLVEWQIRVAEGEELPQRQIDIQRHGHAIEARIYAEDPDNGFMPQSGNLDFVKWPEADLARVDAGYRDSNTVTPFFDPMISKIMVHGADRKEATRKLDAALSQTSLLGIQTNLDFLIRLNRNENVMAGGFHTTFIEHTFLKKHPIGEGFAYLARYAALLILLEKRKQLFDEGPLTGIAPGWRNGIKQWQEQAFLFADERVALRYQLENGDVLANDGLNEFQGRLLELREHELFFSESCMTHHAFYSNSSNKIAIHLPFKGTWHFDIPPRFAEPGSEVQPGECIASMPGTVVAISASLGKEVAKGDPLLTINSMKMENVLSAGIEGIVEEIFVESGEFVEAGKLLVKIIAK